MTGHPDTRLAAIARRPPDEANTPSPCWYGWYQVR
jgi:hypothetical protein